MRLPYICISFWIPSFQEDFDWYWIFSCWEP